jgi:hypothetical protein
MHGFNSKEWAIIDAEARAVLGEGLPEEILWAVQSERSYAGSLADRERTISDIRRTQRRVKYRLLRDDGEVFGALTRLLPFCNVAQLTRLKTHCEKALERFRTAPTEAKVATLMGAASPQGRVSRGVLLLSDAVRNKRFQLERRYCGKSCGGCPHGPYIYAYSHHGDDVKETYLGKNLSRLPPGLRQQFRERMAHERALRIEAKFPAQLKLKMNKARASVQRET